LPVILREVEPLKMQTRCKTDIPNCIVRRPPDHGRVLETASEVAVCRNMANAINRTFGPDPKYNCHGLTFASRRTNITDLDAIDRIIAEDGYIPVEKNDTYPGDIIIYGANSGDGGEIEHSGLIIGLINAIITIPMVLSKLGECHEVVHPYNFSGHPKPPYCLSNIQFLRVMP